MTTDVDPSKHLSREEIEARLDWIKGAPADRGVLQGLCIRPELNQRRELEECLLSPEGGVEGDFWVRGGIRTVVEATHTAS